MPLIELGPAVPELRQYLSQTLPDYMIPAHFVSLPALPLTPNGKIDRNALPIPEETGVDEGYNAPRTPAEDVLAAIWAEVLELERVGRHGNFFELGGHSLLAIRVISRLREAFQVELSVRTVFEAPPSLSWPARLRLPAGSTPHYPFCRPCNRLGATVTCRSLLPSNGSGSWTSWKVQVRSTTFRWHSN
ncbi:hypothetical protein C2W62_47120 [Candidatus Entotheonella serta]|nr:hypothetical protein C2W62_47120 [Candidatus Entotheonella serta]